MISGQKISNIINNYANNIDTLNKELLCCRIEQ